MRQRENLSEAGEVEIFTYDISGRIGSMGQRLR